MGKFNQGILGGFSGKVGNVVGYRSRGEWLYRQYQKEVFNPKSTKQEANRLQFATLGKELKAVCKDQLNDFIRLRWSGANTYFSAIMSGVLGCKKYYETGIIPTAVQPLNILSPATNLPSATVGYSQTAGLIWNNGTKDYFGLRVPLNFYANAPESFIGPDHIKCTIVCYTADKKLGMAFGQLDGEEILELSEYNPQCGWQLGAADTKAQYVCKINDSSFDPIAGKNQAQTVEPIKRPAGKRIAYAIYTDYVGTILAAQYIEVVDVA